MGISPPVPFVCVSGWGWHPLRRWRPSLHCTLTQWWRDVGIVCCSGKWWTDAVYELHCSCLGCWMHSACGSLVHILQGAAWTKEPGSRRSTAGEWMRWSIFGWCYNSFHRNFWITSKLLFLFTHHLPIFLTITLEPLSDQSEQHLSTVITEGWGPVRVHIECMGPNLEIFKRGCR